MPLRWVRIFLLSMSGLLAMGAHVRADDPGDPPGYRALVDGALREYGAGNHAEARELFLRAHALLPSARTHRGLAMTEFELRNYQAAIAEIERALASNVRPLDARLRADVEHLRARARTFVGDLRVASRPAATEVRVDGVPVAPSADATVPLNVGDHVVEAHAPGFAAEKRHVTIQGEQTTALTIVFTRPLATSPAPAPAARGWYRNPWIWSAVGVVVAGAAAGTAVALGRDDTKTGPFDRGNTAVRVVAP